MMKKLPVFVFPISLEFYLAARHTHKQLLTLYNPCDFPVNFQDFQESQNNRRECMRQCMTVNEARTVCQDQVVWRPVLSAYPFGKQSAVMCTSPHKFTVTDPEGAIPPLSCVDVALRYSQPSSAHCHTEDKFRITMHDRITNQVLGKRIVVAKFLAGEPEGVECPEEREAYQPLAAPPPSVQQRAGPPGLLLAVCAVCVGALLLPSAPPPPPTPSPLLELLPPPLQALLHLPPALQLVCSFVLGLLTMVLLRP